MRSMLALCVALSLTGCARPEESPQPAPSSGNAVVVVAANPPPMVVVQNGPFMPGQTWRGSYVCAQGPSGLELRMLQVSGASVQAAFEFHVPQQGLQGSYMMAGQFDAASGRLQLDPVSWIQRPAGYEMVGLVAQVSPDGTMLRGSITNPSCTTLEVRLAR